MSRPPGTSRRAPGGRSGFPVWVASSTATGLSEWRHVGGRCSPTVSPTVMKPKKGSASARGTNFGQHYPTARCCRALAAQSRTSSRMSRSCHSGVQCCRPFLCLRRTRRADGPAGPHATTHATCMRVVRATSGPPGELDPTARQPVIHPPVPPPMHPAQRQLRQRRHRPTRTQHRIGQLEQRIRPRAQTAVERLPKPGKITHTDRGLALAPHQTLRHTAHHGHRLSLRAL